MTQSSELHVVLGAAGGIGHSLVRLLAAQGKHVRAVNRSGHIDGVDPGVQLMAADLLQKGGALAACQGASVIYHCAGVPYERWSQDLPIIMDNVLAAVQATGAVLVYADNCYMYAPTARPMTESMPYAPVTKKGQIRKALAEKVLALHQQGTIRTTIGRATGFYGPGVRVSTMGEQFFPALVSGKSVNWLGPLDIPHAMTFVDDFAAGLLTLGENEKSLGQAWHIPAAEPLTGRQYIDIASELAGVPSKPAVPPQLLLQALGIFNPTIRELVEMLYEYKEPYLIDGSKYLAAFGGSPTPHQDALRQTVAWYKQQNSRSTNSSQLSGSRA